MARVTPFDQYGAIAETLALSGKTLDEIVDILQGAVSRTTLSRWSLKYKWQERYKVGRISPRRITEKLYQVISAKVDALDEKADHYEFDGLVKLYKIFRDEMQESADQFNYLTLDGLEDFFSFCQERLSKEALAEQRGLINAFVAARIVPA
jgi:hypothetical protein